MALTPGRWLTIFVLSCAAIVIWLAPARFGDASINSSVSSYYSGPPFGWPDAAARLEATNLRLRVLELRDSSMGAPVERTAGAGLTIITDRMIPDTIQQAVRSALISAWARYGAGARYPVLVAVVADTSRMNDRLPMANTNRTEAYTFPPDSATPACRILVRVAYPLWRADSGRAHVFQNQVVRVLTLQSTERAILGPCALYATFGGPGPSIAKWLAGTNWLPAADVDWSRPSPIVRSDLNWGDATQTGLLATVMGSEGVVSEARQFLATDAVACIAGRVDQCSTALQSGIQRDKDSQAWQADVIEARMLGGLGRWYWGWGRSGNLGPAENWLLSDMIRDLGADRFEAFWTSGAPPDTAFAHAAGEPFGAWVKRWARRQYGRAEVGPWMPVWARWAGLFVVAAGLGVAMVFGRERRVM